MRRKQEVADRGAGQLGAADEFASSFVHRRLLDHLLKINSQLLAACSLSGKSPTGAGERSPLAAQPSTQRLPETLRQQEKSAISVATRWKIDRPPLPLTAFPGIGERLRNGGRYN